MVKNMLKKIFSKKSLPVNAVHHSAVTAESLKYQIKNMSETDGPRLSIKFLKFRSCYFFGRYRKQEKNVKN
jgi:hypothetical protein